MAKGCFVNPYLLLADNEKSPQSDQSGPLCHVQKELLWRPGAWCQLYGVCGCLIPLKAHIFIRDDSLEDGSSLPRGSKLIFQIFVKWDQWAAAPHQRVANQWVAWRGRFHPNQSRIVNFFGDPKNRFLGTNFARLCSLMGRYDNPINTRFLAPTGSSKIPSQFKLLFIFHGRWKVVCEK